MTPTQFEHLKQIFVTGASEVKNDANLSDWLMNVGGILISLAVDISNLNEDEEYKNSYNK